MALRMMKRALPREESPRPRFSVRLRSASPSRSSCCQVENSVTNQRDDKISVQGKVGKQRIQPYQVVFSALRRELWVPLILVGVCRQVVAMRIVFQETASVPTPSTDSNLLRYDPKRDEKA